MEWHPEILPGTTATKLEELAAFESIQNTYLAGGTAIALQLGHRISRDLDFFTPIAFDENELALKLEEKGMRTESTKWRTVIGSFADVQFTCFYLPYPLLFDPEEYRGIRVANLRDCAAMKLEAIAGRATKRDYIDLSMIMKHDNIELPALLDMHMRKYQPQRDTAAEALRSLTYFDDVETRETEERPLEMLVPIAWEEVKTFFLQQVSENRKYLL